jgi:glycosyltransferase involved in cell wall biosynthesis
MELSGDDEGRIQMETKRIGILSWESMYSVRTGGQAPAVTGLAEALAKKGHEVHFFTRRGEGQGLDDTINGVNYHRCEFDPGRNILEYCRNMSYSMLDSISDIERVSGRFDIIHGHDWHVVDALHELRGKSVLVLTFHSTEFGRNGGEHGDWWEYREISGKEWYGGYVADKVTTVSHTMKNELMYLYQIPDEKISVLPNGIDPTLYQKDLDPGKVKERYGIHPLSPTVFFVGRLVKQKGPDLLVEAIPHVLHHRWDTRFIIAGEGDMRGHLEYLAHGAGVKHAVQFPGYITDEERVSLFNACDIVAITSRNEPFGMVLLEAWSAGKPVVATDIGGPAENIDNFKDGIKVFLNPASIAWGINYSINDPEGLKAMGLSGRAKVERKFAWPSIAKKAEKIYSQILRE